MKVSHTDRTEGQCLAMDVWTFSAFFFVSIIIILESWTLTFQGRFFFLLANCRPWAGACAYLCLWLTATQYVTRPCCLLSVKLVWQWVTGKGQRAWLWVSPTGRIITGHVKTLRSSPRVILCENIPPSGVVTEIESGRRVSDLGSGPWQGLSLTQKHRSLIEWLSLSSSSSECQRSKVCRN